MAEKLLKRSEVPVKDTWKLEDIYPSNQAWEDGLKRLSVLSDGIVAYRGKLGDRESLLKALDLSTEAERLADSLYTYARMRRDEDNANALYQGMVARISQALAALGGNTAFISPEILALDGAYLEGVIADPRFSDYDMLLKDLMRNRPHTLSDREEALLALSRDMGSSAGTIYDMLTDADIHFPEIEDENGEKVRVTQANYIPLVMSRSRKVRKAAFDALYTTYQSFSASIPAMYAGNIKADLFYSKARGHENSLTASLFADNIPVSVYDSLITAVNEHLSALQKFVGINARLNGIDDMHFYDLYLAPELGFDIKLPFKDAYELVIDCLKPLGEEYAQVMHQALNERWIDPYENEGKSSGAYSWGTYDSHPYVLCNYEMGHSLHTWYSSKNQPYPKSQYSLFVAEVASTVNECLVLMELMDKHPEDGAQAYLLYNLLDSFRGTVFRQTMFAEFEKTAHRMAERGEALTSESLNRMYADLNRKYYANLEFDELISCEWMRIPHFYRSFYVYKYATGFSSAMAIAQLIRTQGQSAVENYKEFLKAGCSLYPLDALKLAGVDLSTPKPVRQALDTFDELVERYERVTKRLQEKR